MEKDIKLLEQNIVNHITTGAKGYKSFSAIERIRYADEVLTNTRDYCCALLGLNPEDVETTFIYGKKTNGAAASKDGKSAISMNVLSALSISNPLFLYKVAAHEMRHVYQHTLEKGDPETIAYYPGAGNFSMIDWGASGAEKGADKFAFSTILRLATKGMIKSGDRVCPMQLANLASLAIDSRLSHAGYSFLHKLTSPFRSSYTRSVVDNSFEGTYKGSKDNERISLLSLKELEDFAREKPEIYAKPLEGGRYTGKHVTGLRREVAEDINSHIIYKRTHLRVRTVPSGVTLRRAINPSEKTYKVEGIRFSNKEESDVQAPAENVATPVIPVKPLETPTQVAVSAVKPENQTQPAILQPGYVVSMFTPEAAQTLTTIRANAQQEYQGENLEEKENVFATVIENILSTRQGVATEVDASEISFDESIKMSFSNEENFSSADISFKNNDFAPEQ